MAERIELAELTSWKGEGVERYLQKKLAEGLTAGVLITHRGILSEVMQTAASQDKVARNVVNRTRAPK